MKHGTFIFFLFFLTVFLYGNVLFSQTVNLGVDKAVCGNSVVIGIAPEAGVNYTWSKPDGTLSGYIVIDGSSATVNLSGTYVLTATDIATGNTVSDEIVIIIDTPPTVTLPAGQVLCTNGTAFTITPLGSFGAAPSFAWYKNGVLMPGETSSTLTVANTTANIGSYAVVVTKVEPPACTGSASVFIDVVEPPIDVLLPKMIDCGAEGTITTAPFLAGHTYLWATSTATDGGMVSAANFDTLRVNKSGKYYLTITNAAGCARYDSINFKLSNPKTVDLGGPYVKCVDGGAFSLNAAHADNLNKVTYQWFKDGTVMSGETNATLSLMHPNETHAYYAVITDTTGGYNVCTATTSIAEVTFRESPLAAITGHDVTKGTCQEKDTLYLNVTNLTSYYTTWSGPGITGFDNDSLTVFVNQSGKYSVRVREQASGCEKTFDIDLTFHPTPVVNLGDDKVFCKAEGAYILNAKDASHAAGAVYSWYKDGTVIPGETADKLTVFTLGTYAYKVRVVNPSGCFVEDEAKITFNPEPVIDITGHDVSVGTCDSEVTLTASGEVNGMDIKWFLNDLSNNIESGKTEIKVSKSAIYWLRVSNPITGCFSLDSQTVHFHQRVFVNLPDDEIILCQNKTVELNAYDPSHAAGGDVTYEWKLLYPGNPTLDVVLGTDKKYTASFADHNSFDKKYYAVTVKNTLTGCSATDMVIIQFERQPFSDAGDDVAVCLGDKVKLSGFASQTTSYLWYRLLPDGSKEILSDKEVFEYAPTVSETVYLQTDGAGLCEYSIDEVKITVNIPPQIKINIDNASTHCVGDPIVLDVVAVGGNAGLRYLWNTGETSKSITVFPEDITGYSVRVFDANNCTAWDSVLLLVEPPFKFDKEMFACEGESRTIGFESSNPITTYSWNTGETSPFITVDSTGTYTLTITTGDCIYSQSTKVTFKKNPRTLLRADTVVCYEDEKLNYERKRIFFMPELTEPDPTALYFYVWRDENDKIISRRDTLWTENEGTYFLTVTTDLGCTHLDTIKVTETCPPRIWFPEGFTPDGDGINDRFEVFGAHVIKFEMQITNRWGETIYHKKAPVFEEIKQEEWWDGTFRDSKVPCPDGMYYWTAVYYSKLSPYYPLRKSGFLIFVK